MTMKRWDGTTQVDTTTEKRWDGASWVDLTIARRWDGSSWVDIAFPGGGGGTGLSAVISDGTPSGSVFDPEPAPLFRTVFSNSTTVTASGGTGPYTYSWARVSGDSAVLVSNNTSNVVSFSANVAKNSDKSATWRCTITDSLMATTTVDCSITLTYFTDI